MTADQESILEFKANILLDYEDLHEARDILARYGIQGTATVTEIYDVSEEVFEH